MRQYDYIVIGGGSGGIASARRAVRHGARVALVEARKLGGTCVHAGCVPKKMMFNAASLAQAARDAQNYGFAIERGRFDWAAMKEKRDAAISRLQGIYERNLASDGVERIDGRGRLLSNGDGETPLVVVNGERLSAPHVLLATGGFPRIPELSGAHLGITSNGFFELESLPKRVAIAGAGYVGVELAGIFSALGSQVTLFARHATPLWHFDTLIQQELLVHLESAGIEFCGQAEPQRITRAEDGLLRISAHQQPERGGFDELVWAVGRLPASAGLELSKIGIATDAQGHITVDEFQNTNVPGVYAVGDVTGKSPLTPVAIAAGRRLADRIFDSQPEARLDYDHVPTVVFSHPPVGTVGLSETHARARFLDDIQVYQTRFTNLFYAITPNKPKTAMKIVTQASTDKLLGIHVIGRDADEMIQGFAALVQMGATKADLDRTIAIHPTAAEELVTMT